MPDFRIGTATPTALRLGTSPVSKLYRGTTQVWTSTPPSTLPVQRFVRSEWSGNGTGANKAAMSIPTTGIQTGDLLITTVSEYDIVYPHPPAPCSTQLFYNRPADPVLFAGYWGIVTGAPPATFVWDTTNNAPGNSVLVQHCIVTLTCVQAGTFNAASPFNVVSAVMYTTTGGANMAFPSVTTTGPNRLVYGQGMSHGECTSVDPPGGWTNVHEVTTDWQGEGVMSKEMPAAGATGAGNMTIGPGTWNSMRQAVIYAINPA